MITTITLINISLPHIVTILYVVKVPEIHSLRKFLVFDTVLLTIVIMLYIRPLDLFILHNYNTVLFDQHLSISLTSPPLANHSSLCFYVFNF